MPLSSWLEASARRPVIRGGVRFLAVILVGWWAWTPLGSGFTAAFSGLASVALGDFGSGGHAEFFVPEREHTASAARAGSWDSSVELSVEGVRKTHVIALNPRRLAFLPLLFFAAFLAAAPLPPRRKAEDMLLGLALLSLIALGSVWITIAWLFARVPGLVYDFAPWQRSALHLLYGGFVTPIANKFIVPLLLALAFVFWRAPPATRADAADSEPGAQPIRAGKEPTPRARGSRRRRRR